MDIFVLKALVDALRQHLRGAVVSKVFQMSPHDLLLRLWRHQDLRLLLSAQAPGPRLHLTTARFRNPPQPLRFAAFLRAHLSQVRLYDITVRPYDRVVSLSWERPDAAGPVLTLIHELYGQHSNMMLVDAAGLVLAVLKPGSATATPQRLIAPGQPYQPLPLPAQRWLVPDLTVAALAGLQEHGLFDAKGLQRLVVGLSATLAAELMQRSQGQPQRCWEMLQELRQQYDQGTLTLFLCTTPQGTRHVSALPLTHCAETSIPYSNAHEAVTALYEPMLQTTSLHAFRVTLHKTVSQRLQKLRRKMANLTQDRSKLEQYLPYQRYGTLLVTQRVPRGTPSVTLVDYYSPTQETLIITLDPRLSVQGNAQVYFKKYRKTQSGLTKIHELLDQCRHEEQRLDTLVQHLTQAEDWETLETIAAALQHAPATHRARPVVPTVSTPPYRTFVLHDGYTLYCGKSAAGNEALLRQIARPEDIWLHAHRHAGAHVVLKVQPQQNVPPQTLQQAAALAAFYSKGKDAASVEVIYAYAKNVQKFRGAPPGQVRVTEYRTVEVTPQLPED